MSLIQYNRRYRCRASSSRPSTHRRRRLNCRVKSRRRCVHNSQLVGDSLHESEQICQQRSRVASCRRRERTRQQSWQFTISCAVELRLVKSDDILTSLLKKLSISIKILVVWSVSKLSTESVGSRRELVANCVNTADADATQLGSCVVSASAVCIRHGFSLSSLVIFVCVESVAQLCTFQFSWVWECVAFVIAGRRLQRLFFVFIVTYFPWRNDRRRVWLITTTSNDRVVQF